MTNISNRTFSLNYSFLNAVNRGEDSFSRLGGKYRSRLEIMTLMLEAINHNGSSISFITRYAKINHKQFKEYLNFLIRIGFITVNIQNSKISYKISDRGLSFLRQYYTLIEMLCFQREKKQLTPFLRFIRKDTAKK